MASYRYERNITAEDLRLQAEDPAAFHKLKDFAGLGIKGFPAFVVFPHEPSEREP